ncbi:MAG: hypothetical protein MK108_14295 [Mariniblastus sp.]|nr:hypothetical protein [Mariniblastus sp.]
MLSRLNTTNPWLAFVLTSVVLVGCQPGQTTVDPGEPAADQLTGKEILSEVFRQYQAAETYTDRALLYLNYRIDGRLVQEPQPWSVSWSRKDGLSTRLFNSQVQFDGQLMSCFVFDIESANLDDQQWVMRTADSAEIDRLLADPIGQHFMCGYSELPLDETEKSLAACLVPPALRLCGGSQSNSWLTSDSSIERLADQMLDGIPCYVVQIASPQGNYELYVNQQTGLIEQLNLPFHFLDQRVLSADEIEEIQLFARFHDAQLNAAAEPGAFEVKRREQAKVVSQFVTIPERFPSPWIGKKLPPLELQKTDGTNWSHSDLSGQTIALCWFANDTDTLKQFVQLAGETPKPGQSFFAIYSDGELNTPGDPSSGLSPELQSRLPDSPPGPQWLYDPQLSTTVQLKLSTVPAVMIIGPAGQLQYVQGMSEPDWPTQLQAAMRRIEQGEDVAAEMRREYENYRQQYDDQLAANDPGELFAGPGDEAAATEVAPPRVRFQKQWESGTLTSGGNLDSQQEQLYVLDGFQTIVVLDSNGQTATANMPLKLPESHGVNRLRSMTTRDGQQWFAGFSMLGRTVFLFDPTWQTVYQYPPTGTPHDGISDVQLVDTGSGQPELQVAFVGQQGIHQVDTTTGEAMVLSRQPTRSLTAGPQNLYVSGDELRRLKDGSTVDQAYQYRVVTGDSRIRVALGKNQGNRWNLVAFGPTGQRLWERPVGPQDFATDLENVSLSPGQNWLAIADAKGQVELIDFSGQQLGEHRFDQPIHGINWLNDPAGNHLAVSFADHVELWQIEPAPIHSVSGEWSAPNK